MPRSMLALTAARVSASKAARSAFGAPQGNASYSFTSQGRARLALSRHWKPQQGWPPLGHICSWTLTRKAKLL